ncbi:hypothetical protein GCM10027446_31330 [Angustibacter peucedani]
MPDDTAPDADRPQGSDAESADEQTQAVGGEPTRALPEEPAPPVLNPWSNPAEPPAASAPPAAASGQDTPPPPPSNPYVQPAQTYGQPPQPTYGTPPPGYGQPPAAPGYGQQQPPPQPPYGGYGAPPPPPGYGAHPGQPGQPGQPMQYGGPPPGYYGPTTSGRATAVLICGIASLVLLFSCIGFIPAIVALVLARGAQREIDASGGRLLGEGQLRAGRICSWITIGISALALVGFIIFIVIGVATGGFDSSTTYDGGY